jgi:hypothetical protein
MRYATSFNRLRPDPTGFTYVVCKAALSVDGQTYKVGETVDVTGIPSRRFRQLVASRYLQPKEKKGRIVPSRLSAGKKTRTPGATNLLPPAPPASTSEEPPPAPSDSSPSPA